MLLFVASYFSNGLMASHGRQQIKLLKFMCLLDFRAKYTSDLVYFSFPYTTFSSKEETCQTETKIRNDRFLSSVFFFF